MAYGYQQLAQKYWIGSIFLGYYPRKNKQGAPSTWPDFVGSKVSTYSQDFSPKRDQESGMGTSIEKILETPRFSSQADRWRPFSPQTKSFEIIHSVEWEEKKSIKENEESL